MSSRTDLRVVVAALVVAVCVVLFPGRAAAYPWMLRHGSTQCGSCHADPSGSGLLTPFGRTRGEQVLRTHYGAPARPALGKLLFGLDAPEGLLLGGSFRNGLLVQHVANAPQQPDPRFLQMQADLRAQLTVGRLRVSGSLGFLHEGGRPTRVTKRDKDNLVSREHWIGVDLGEERAWLIRAGRMNLPYGLRNNEHTLWIRSALRTDVNEGQQHGAALAYAAGPDRAEVMAVVGNLQLSPDVYREQGVVGYYERAFGKHVALGVSGLLLHSAVDVQVGKESTRQGYGAFARLSPRKQLVFLAELDALLQKVDGVDLGTGWVSMLSTDLEPVEGVHLVLTGEARKLPLATGTALGEWLSCVWFFAPHSDLRLDGVFQVFPGQGGGPTVRATTLLAQLHLYL